MVVEDDHVGPLGGGDGVVRKRAAVDAEDEVVGEGQGGHGGDVRAVALVDPVGDVERRGEAEVAEPGEEKGGGGASVDVVVGEDGDPFPARDGLEEAVGGGTHVLQRHRVGEEVAQGGGKEGGCGLGGDATGGEDAAEGERQAGLLGHAFGQPVGSFQNSRFRLAEMKTEVDIARVFVDRCVEALGEGTLTAEEAAEAKWWCTELQKRVVDGCLQLHGGYGYMLEYPIARAYIDARITTIYGGTTEIMKEIIGRSLGV